MKAYASNIGERGAFVSNKPLHPGVYPSVEVDIIPWVEGENQFDSIEHSWEADKYILSMMSFLIWVNPDIHWRIELLNDHYDYMYNIRATMYLNGETYTVTRSFAVDFYFGEDTVVARERITNNLYMVVDLIQRQLARAIVGIDIHKAGNELLKPLKNQPKTKVKVVPCFMGDK